MMEVSELWKREHGTGDDMEDTRRAMREANARHDRRWRSFGRVVSETLSFVAAIVIVITALAVCGKLLILLWAWILS